MQRGLQEPPGPDYLLSGRNQADGAPRGLEVYGAAPTPVIWKTTANPGTNYPQRRSPAPLIDA